MTLLRYLLILLVALAAFMVVRTLVVLPAGVPLSLKPAQIDPIEATRIAGNLSTAIQFQTISHSLDRAPDNAAFSGFHEFLSETYPAVHEVMTLETVSGYSLMYRWPAGKPSSRKPVALLAHMDVVPVPAHGISDWRQPPFAGVIDADGTIWGRGALDDKGILISIMEAAERLVTAGFAPDRDIYLLFGHDEELGGDKGAALMAKRLEESGVQLAWAMDEGSAIVNGIIPGVESPVALISLGEKGSATLKFSAEDAGGHSSAPKNYTAASLAAAAGVAVTENQYPLVLDEHLEAMLMAIAPEMDFSKRLAIANLWATRGLLTDQLAKSPTVAAFMHTTTAFTMMNAGTKSNILPQYGEALVNYRIHPRDSVASVMARAEAIVADERITITNMGGGREATSMSEKSGEGYSLIEATIRAEFGDIPIAPTLTVQGTDARHYGEVADGTYRFMPFVAGPDTLKQIHGTNEHISSVTLARQVDFFEALIRRSAGAGIP